jgi:hypothetical protein
MRVKFFSLVAELILGGPIIALQLTLREPPERPNHGANSNERSRARKPERASSDDRSRTRKPERTIADAPPTRPPLRELDVATGFVAAALV